MKHVASFGQQKAVYKLAKRVTGAFHAAHHRQPFFANLEQIAGDQADDAEGRKPHESLSSARNLRPAARCVASINKPRPAS